MAGIKYDKILADLQRKIEEEEYPFQSLIPSETVLSQRYGCSRNTVRRAVNDLVSRGYVQSLHGKGVRVIYQPYRPAIYTLARVESFKETIQREKGQVRTEVVLFAELAADEKLSQRTTFAPGTEIYYIQRVRYFDGKALIMDHNYFRKDIAAGLTREIARESIYEYLEETLNVNIVTTKRIVTVERVTPLDEKHLELRGTNCVAVVTNFTYNDAGVMFEYTQSRHCADHFVFHDNAHRVRSMRNV